MTLGDLEFEAVGCCGEYRRAIVATPHGDRHVYDDGAAGIRTLLMRDGLIVSGSLQAGLDRAALDAVLQGA